jgi:parvulin-like peptidyl-prolyl isomerase
VPSPTLAASEVVATYEANVRTYRQELSNQSRVGGDELDKFFREQALRDAVGETLLVDNKTLYVNARHILVETEEEAQEILTALNNGESFADLAIANSTDTGSGAKGGELGWTPAANFVKEFKQAVTDLPIGEISQPIKTEFGYHIIQVRAREQRDVEETERATVQNALFSSWLADLRTANEANIERYDWTSYVPQN